MLISIRERTEEQIEHKYFFDYYPKPVPATALWSRIVMENAKNTEEGVLETYKYEIMSFDRYAIIYNATGSFVFSTIRVNRSTNKAWVSCPDLFGLEDWLEYLGISKDDIKRHIQLILTQFNDIIWSL